MVRFAEDMAEQSHTRPPIYLYTDGAASGNPGPGGYGIVLKCAGISKELSGGFRLTTNNRMELLAVIIGLESIRWTNAEVHVVSDSSYVVKAINEGWLEKWERKGFAKVKNHVDGFFFCVADESASVDYCYLTLRVLRIVSHTIAVQLQLAHGAI